MILESLRIKNFRILEDFKIEKLGRLNLIVGKNNSGKSTVLEALRIYAANAEQKLLDEIAREHEESRNLIDGDLLPFQSFFSGRIFPDQEDSPILIGDSSKSSDWLCLEHVYCERFEETTSDDKGGTSTVIKTRTIKKSEKIQDADEIFEAIRISKNQKELSLIEIKRDSSKREKKNRKFSVDGIESTPCSIVPTQDVSMSELADEWDKIALTEYEEQLKTALKFIDDRVEGVAFIKNNNDDYADSESFFFPFRKFKRFAKVKISNFDHPVPLNSMGDGMRKVLRLAVQSFSAKDGFFLIDEFENGLHFSVQKKIWSWLFDLAERFNIQVFATTHSWDCIESFSNVAKEKQHIRAVLLRVGSSQRTSNKGKVIATEFSEETLWAISQADVEVR